MGYRTNADSVIPPPVATSAHSKIAAAGVFLGTAAGLSRTESSFANLDWLLVGGPP